MIAAFVLAGALAAASPAPRPGEPVEEQIQQNALIGEFAALPNAARQPAVIVLGGFEGGVPGQAYAFARQGYAGFAVAYFRAGNLPQNVEEIPVETVSRAIDYLRARPEVDPNRIGLVGVSKGAELALIAATRDTRVKSVAVVSPSAYVWFAPVFGGGGAAGRSSWYAGGGPLTFVPPDRAATANLDRAVQNGSTYAFRELYDASLAAASPTAVAIATIPVERIAGPLLCVAGDDDRQWDSAGSCKAIAARRQAANAGARDAVAIEPGAGHIVTLGGHGSPELVPAGRVKLRMGGTPEGNMRAAADAWNRTLTFFARTL
ncbi:MAG TPA: acyl-CoA thioester hydrolase/BAAT C-terminal domain-containing protein [Candidatus Elarobacter sp.]|jgi:dienelactone hydrolase